MGNFDVCPQNLKPYKLWPPQDVYFLSMCGSHGSCSDVYIMYDGIGTQ